jgi:signal transduction histidine kinase
MHRSPDKLIKPRFDMGSLLTDLSPDIQARSARLRATLVILVLGALVAWTVLVVAGVLPPDVMWPRARLPLETAGVFVVSLAAALAFIRFSLTGVPSQLLVSLAFVTLASSQLVLGVILHPGTLRITPDRALYLWMPGRFLAGLLLIAATLPANLKGRDHPGRHREFLVAAAIVIVGLLPAEMLLWLARHGLPPLYQPGDGLLPRLSNGRLPVASTPDIVLGLALTGIYVVAAYRFWKLPREVGSIYSPYLVVALLLVMFSQFHQMLLPTISSGLITSGDVLRILFWGALVIGQTVEVRQTYFSERARTRELAALYETERSRVRDLEQIDREKAELAQLLTHDFLHAVAALRSYAVTLTKRWPTLSNELRLEVAQWIERETGRLRDLAEQGVFVLEARGREVDVRPRPEQAVELVREAADAVDELGGRLLVTIRAGSERARVLADRTRVLQVTRNLLLNAESYSSPGTPIRLEVIADSTEVIFTVSDQGSGIPPEHTGLLFHQFSRLPNADRNGRGGSGLGLYISRQIVEAHGGRIWVESTPGQGTSFAFSLPRAEDAR